ncbi:transcriptional regulator [bacterium 19MO03SA05]|uniref:Transcriptional regulator n=1 Tax=bacterium 19MO03SA05 TaxID=2920620 RepID=A0AAU6VGV7_UNCXX|nr:MULTISPECIES: transcriptional regulator [unclassified Vibrio]EKO3922093.1 transcriptional regulator [Vibrio metschnikovii]MDQ2107315.1 transcriptional regulator [Vibrio sp. 2017_1457_15]MDQ2160127.1 transcriptional regulator [Vibrio sp. 2017_1457_13]
MSVCVALVDGVVTISQTGVCDYILMSKSDVTQLVDGQFDWSLLQFDKSLYQFVIGQALVTFILGHTLGRVIKYLGKR